MKKIFLSILAFSLYGASTFAQSAEVKLYAEKSAEAYCTCNGFVKLIDAQIAAMDNLISSEELANQTNASMKDMQMCTIELNQYMPDLNRETAGEVEKLTQQIMDKKYPDCAKKIARLTEKK